LKRFENGNHKLKAYYKNQKENPSQNELDRRKKISDTLIGREITWSDKISKALIGNTNPQGHIVSKETRKLISENASEAIQEKIQQEGFYWGMSGKQHSLESNRKNRESCIAYIEKFRLNGQPLKPRIGRNEKEILDKLEIEFGHKILRQFKIAGYFIDGYIPEIKLAIEIDEDFHVNQKDSDLVRQKEIENLLDCIFIRIED